MRVQNASARLVLGLSPRDRVSPTSVELVASTLPHPVPIPYPDVYMGHTVRSPSYISDAVTPSSEISLVVDYVPPTTLTTL